VKKTKAVAFCFSQGRTMIILVLNNAFTGVGNPFCSAVLASIYVKIVATHLSAIVAMF
jgi:hypothetical protein